MISFKKNKEPILNKPSFNVDGMLDSKLEKIDVFSLMNKPHFLLLLGKAGSGKSSLTISFLKSKEAYKNIFHDIILFCPANSRHSVRGDFWGEHIPEELIYDELNLDNLNQAYQLAEENAQEDFKTLIILDDVQKFLRGDCEKFLLHMINNRRHAHLCIWLCCQNYKSIPTQTRQALTDLIVFKVNKTEMSNIFDEQVEMFKNAFNKILQKTYKKNHDFIYINTNSQRMFYNWDEILL